MENKNLNTFDDSEEDFKFKERKKTLINKFGLDKDYIKESDLGNLAEKMNLTICKEEIKKIFTDLDENNTGAVKLHTFLDALDTLNMDNSNNDNAVIKNKYCCNSFLKKINEQLTTKSERIILKLKKLKEKALFANDKESLDDFDWIISSFNEDMFEPDFDYVLDKNRDFKMDNAMDWIAQASRAQQFKERQNDILQANKGNNFKRLKTTSFFIRNSNNSSYSLPEDLVKLMNLSISDRNSSTLSELAPELVNSVSSILNKIDSFDFSIFDLNELIERKTLHFMTSEIFNKYNFFDELIDEPKYKNFIKVIIDGYDREVVYHNDLHAGDVMQTVYVMIEKGDLINKLYLNDIDVLASLLAAVCHDFRHNGFNNTFHVNDKSHIAIAYNDSSVLENFHVAETFKVLMIEENNLLCNLKPEEWRLVRRRMIDCILSTDMANHAKHVNSLKAKFETFGVKSGKNIDKMIFPENVAKTYETQQMILGMCLHTADISNPAKPQNINQKWVEKVFHEFFNQGDIEKSKGLPVSLLCDRDATNVNKSQIGFINFVVSPTFEVMMNLIPEISPYYDNIQANLKRYETIVNEESCSFNVVN